MLEKWVARMIGGRDRARFERQLFEKMRGTELKPGEHCYLCVVQKGTLSEVTMKMVQSYLQNKGINLVWIVAGNVDHLRIVKTEPAEKLSMWVPGEPDLNQLAHELKQLITGMQSRTRRLPDAADILVVLERCLKPSKKS